MHPNIQPFCSYQTTSLYLSRDIGSGEIGVDRSRGIGDAAATLIPWGSKRSRRLEPLGYWGIKSITIHPVEVTFHQSVSTSLILGLSLQMADVSVRPKIAEAMPQRVNVISFS